MASEIELLREALRWALDNGAALGDWLPMDGGDARFTTNGCGCCADFATLPPEHLRATLTREAAKIRGTVDRVPGPLAAGPGGSGETRGASGATEVGSVAETLHEAPDNAQATPRANRRRTRKRRS